MFIIWTHRAYQNVRALGITDIRFGTGWAIGGWFVPILWLWRPKQIINDIWRGSDPDLGGGWRLRWADIRPPVVVTLWWLAGLLSTFVSLFAPTTPTTIDQAQSLTTTFLISDAVTILTAVLAIVVVRRLTERQQARAIRIAAFGQQSFKTATPSGP
ncbi:MAG: DUF4328 domain-containing protein [Actinomycetota bacterium]|nr:DUF4328 domain-containing protein [Actinomycetota bacterium]